MIQIDDTGWGSLIGGVLVGVYRDESAEFTYGVVAPKFFQGEAFAAKAYIAEGGVQVAACFEHLHVRADEKILCCTGYVLDGVCEWLAARGYKFERGKITGPLQGRIEGALQDYLAGLGFAVDYKTLTQADKKGLFWWKQVQWLKGGDVNATRPVPERVALCKTGWASFNTWANHPYREARALAQAAKSERSRKRWARRREG
jgi:hypothetical protein